eukprot:TRINITY_DN3494_c0_g1_i4.p1 TRINITY_DN3494_c0_g1~~TRINITY_DN3494_c0_g1_i4.p1  ORF type:complete len:559 (+),score=135.20 TRINITY_DN3494_c0_g1_i4:106-1677(+)
MERRSPEREGAQQCGGVERISPKGIDVGIFQAGECPAPPPRRVARPVFGLCSVGPSRPQSATPPPRDPKQGRAQDEEDSTPRRADDCTSTVERLEQENLRLREALAAAEQTIRELTAQLAAASALPQGGPPAAELPAAEGRQQSGRSSRRRSRNWQKKAEQPAGAEEGEDAVVASQMPDSSDTDPEAEAAPETELPEQAAEGDCSGARQPQQLNRGTLESTKEGSFCVTVARPNPTTGIGAVWDAGDNVVTLSEVVRGGLADRAGMMDKIGMRCTEACGKPIFCGDDLIDATFGHNVLAFTLLPPADVDASLREDLRYESASTSGGERGAASPSSGHRNRRRHRRRYRGCRGHGRAAGGGTQEATSPAAAATDDGLLPLIVPQQFSPPLPPQMRIEERVDGSGSSVRVAVEVPHSEMQSAATAYTESGLDAFGEALIQHVQQYCPPHRACKVTGMILDLGARYACHVMSNPRLLRDDTRMASTRAGCRSLARALMRYEQHVEPGPLREPLAVPPALQRLDMRS